MITETFAKQTFLSKNFTLYELLKSDVAIYRGLMYKQFSINQDFIGNLGELCKNVLQPLRTFLKKPVTVDSGYRCLIVNELVGGSKTSDHMTGKAADLTYIDFVKAFNFISNNLDFKQLIVEKRVKENGEISAWMHVSYDRLNNKKQRLFYKNGEYVLLQKTITAKDISL